MSVDSPFERVLETGHDGQDGLVVLDNVTETQNGEMDETTSKTRRAFRFYYTLFDLARKQLVESVLAESEELTSTVPRVLANVLFLVFLFIWHQQRSTKQEVATRNNAEPLTELNQTTSRWSR